MLGIILHDCEDGQGPKERFRRVHAFSDLDGLLALCDFEDDLEFYWHPEGKAGNANYQPDRYPLDSKDISKQVGDGLRDFGLVEEVSVGCHEYSEPDNASHSIQRAQMLLGRSERAQSRGVGGIASSLDVESLFQAGQYISACGRRPGASR